VGGTIAFLENPAPMMGSHRPATKSARRGFGKYGRYLCAIASELVPTMNARGQPSKRSASQNGFIPNTVIFAKIFAAPLEMLIVLLA
jgi:hypothetical protein